jgi:hypothetical protein
MEPEDIDRFVIEYFDDYDRLVREIQGNRAERLAAQAEDAAREGPDMIDRFERMDPETAWRAVVALIERAPSDETLFFVAAGPLEDLIRSRTAWVGPRVLEHARADPRFRQALGGVLGLERLHEPVRADVLRLLGASEGAIRQVAGERQAGSTR